MALSRERLRAAMGPKPKTASTVARGSATDGASAAEPVDHGKGGTGAWHSLTDHPAAAAVLALVYRWWERHPLRLVGIVATGATVAVVRPMAQRNPVVMVLAALLLGGALAWSRPWRWLLTPALLTGLAPRVISKLMALAPASSWLAVLDSLFRQPRAVDPATEQWP
ncbi:MAG: hypothetical protein AD742_15780 [Methylibium sp. NZG]|nr:MAG: hypothetical protein AD742_15780 [Methylibium sp. NZG]